MKDKSNNMPLRKENVISFLTGSFIYTLCGMNFINPLRQNNYFVAVVLWVVLLVIAIIGGILGLEVKEMLKKKGHNGKTA